MVEHQVDRLAAEQLDQVVVHDLDHHLTGRDALQHLLADRALAHRGDEVLDHRQGDVGLEQGDADVAQRRLDVALAQRAAALEPVEDVAETTREVFEHALAWAGGSGARNRTGVAVMAQLRAALMWVAGGAKVKRTRRLCATLAVAWRRLIASIVAPWTSSRSSRCTAWATTS